MPGPEARTERLFSYGTLRLEPVQRATFGRALVGAADVLEGFELVALTVDDPAVIAISGKAEHTMARYTGRAADAVAGTVLELTAAELRAADGYEVPAVTRVAVVLRSGTRAWAYVEARTAPRRVRPGRALTPPAARGRCAPRRRGG